MKVAVITRHAISNYGSLLQTLAMQNAIESLGHQCVTVDYLRRDESVCRHEITLLRRKPEWYANPVKRAVYLAFRQPESILAAIRFERERKRYLRLTGRYATLEQLRQHKPEADVYMTGSDQVWGPVADGTDDSAYCLSFTAEGDRRVAYAASFGQAELSEARKAYFTKWLRRYRTLTVRESSAVALVEGMGLAAAQVLDPTLLMDAAAWSRYAGIAPKGKYVLVYQLHNDPMLSRYAASVARRKKLPLVRVSASLHQISRAGRLVWVPKASAFLAYLKNAACVITDSFHGTAFSIGFNTPFVAVLPNNGTGARNISLLQLTGLSGRILTDEKDTELADQAIDFAPVNRILAAKRAESLRILQAMIEA